MNKWLTNLNSSHQLVTRFLFSFFSLFFNVLKFEIQFNIIFRNSYFQKWKLKESQLSLEAFVFVNLLDVFITFLQSKTKAQLFRFQRIFFFSYFFFFLSNILFSLMINFESNQNLGALLILYPFQLLKKILKFVGNSQFKVMILNVWYILNLKIQKKKLKRF